MTASEVVKYLRKLWGGHPKEDALDLLNDWYSQPHERDDDYWEELERELRTQRLRLRSDGNQV